MAPKRANRADQSELSSMYTDEAPFLSQRSRQVT